MEMTSSVLVELYWPSFFCTGCVFPVLAAFVIHMMQANFAIQMLNLCSYMLLMKPCRINQFHTGRFMSTATILVCPSLYHYHTGKSMSLLLLQGKVHDCILITLTFLCLYCYLTGMTILCRYQNTLASIYPAWIYPTS